MIHCFLGYDQREAIGWHCFVSSLLRRTSAHVAIHRLDACGLPQGSNEFTMSRFLVPYVMGFKDRAIFFDAADMLCLGDVAELDALFDDRFAVQVVKHDYITMNTTKYIGTTMECPNRDYNRKNWASAMLVNCGHDAWRHCTPEYLATRKPIEMLTFEHMYDHHIGSLPNEWNRLVDEDQPLEGAKIAHWTAGIPAFPRYMNAPGADLWRAERHLVMDLPI